MRWPADHPERYALAEEVHARPPEPLEVPSRLSYLAVLVDLDERAREAAQLRSLCERHGAMPPPPGATQYVARIASDSGTVRLKWERHGEFSSYTVIAPIGEAETAAQPFVRSAAALLPGDWIASVPGITVMCGHALLLRAGDAPPSEAQLARYFEPNAVVGGQIADGAAYAFTDFKLREDGATRFVMLDRHLTARQAGRAAQRLFEIEAYRMLALLALPVARRQSPRLVEIERELAKLTDGIASDAKHAADEALLGELTRLAAEIESGLAASQFRFGACRAYAELVRTRIADLREVRLAGVQGLGEFMSRRFEPAVATCATVSQRLHDLSERVAQASHLLSTRVNIARERQNQALLASMDRRAKLQLRLQQTVEGLSVAAIVYYAAGLVGYAAKGAKAAGARLDPDIATGVAVPLLLIAAIVTLRRVRRRIARDDAAHDH